MKAHKSSSPDQNLPMIKSKGKKFSFPVALEESAMKFFTCALCGALLFTTACGAQDALQLVDANKISHRDRIAEREVDQDIPPDPTTFEDSINPRNPDPVKQSGNKDVPDLQPEPKPEQPNDADKKVDPIPQNPDKKEEKSLQERMISFTLPPPSDEDMESSRLLWATYYYLPEVSSVSSGFPLLASDGAKLGPSLSKRDWCNAAMEGSIRVLHNGVERTYNYASSSSKAQVDCSEYFPHKLGGTRFKIARGPFGDGVKNYKLVPFRTIAVDKSLIPYGTVIYIPAARGTKITLGDGTNIVHDGYFFAGDTGGAIKQNHIDVFIGTAKVNPFSWVKSSSSKTFSSNIVSNSDLTSTISLLHTK